MYGLPQWNITETTGYVPTTTFWNDFSIAEVFGGYNTIIDTYNRAFDGWKWNYVYLTELVLVLNHKIWQHYGHNEAFAKLYNNLWQRADAYALETLRGSELSYFLNITD